MGIIILNHGNNMNQLKKITERGKGSINKYISYQIDIIIVNADERNMMRRSKRKLICQTGVVSTTVLDH